MFLYFCRDEIVKLSCRKLEKFMFTLKAPCEYVEFNIDFMNIDHDHDLIISTMQISILFCQTRVLFLVTENIVKHTL